MQLIIVESPTKAKTISKFLDSSFTVGSSFGHVRDLPKSIMGIDIEHDFTPKYIVPVKAKKNITALKALVAKADKVILASDEDREGEAIAWHLAEVLKLSPKDYHRIVFHEITKDAILAALEHPRELDLNLIDAQQARRVLDRLVGYELSPFLWKKVAKGLSAGRVQSVAVRMVVERERKILAFKPEEYWNFSADFKSGTIFNAPLYKVGKKIVDRLFVKDEATAKKIEGEVKGSKFTVAKFEKKEVTRNPLAPFTTSTLQQAANRILGMSAKKTMMLAQRLYEFGHITYMRTDSLNLSEKFIIETKDYLKKTLGAKYVVDSGKRFKTKSKGAQEAHEAIRPTSAFADPESLSLENDQLRLYRLIWQRAVASQMPGAIFATATAEISSADCDYSFKATGQVLIFDGYLKYYPEKAKEQDLPELKMGEKLELMAIKSEQKFTEPPARYSDAGLVKEMEKYGIGRPSTYAPTIATIIDRNYVNRDEKKRLAPSEIAFVVIDLLVKHFSEIVDYEFTAAMEKSFDEISEGRKKWVPVIAEFYHPFHTNLSNKYEELNKNDIMPEETTTEICDKCGSPMAVKTGRYGKFLACTGFPNCRNIKSLGGEKGGQKPVAPELLEKYKGEVCDKCGEPMNVKNGKFGPFLGCSGYPKCKNIKNINTDGPEIDCPKCHEGKIVKKFSKRGPFYACSNYPHCKNAYRGRPLETKCPSCGEPMIDLKGEIVCSDPKCGD